MGMWYNANNILASFLGIQEILIHHERRFG